MSGADQEYRPGLDGPFSEREAAHLFRRAGFGAHHVEVRRAVEEGLPATLERLFDAREGTEAERLRSLASTATEIDDLLSLQALWLMRMRLTEAPVAEKAALFWHGHLATSHRKVSSAPLMWRQYELLREKALGSLEELLQGISRDPAMLVFLDGNLNRKGQPNENYARELMELFSTGPGAYRERDIQEAARAFSGWHVRDGKFWFNRRAHDDGVKQVFGRSVRTGEEVVELCARHPSTARFVAAKLCRFYVRPDPPEEWVDAVSRWWIEEGRQLGPVLRKLFASRMMFDPASQQSTITSPVDYVIGALRVLRVAAPMKDVARATARMGQELFDPPSVKGWDGGRRWIHAQALAARHRFASRLVWGGEGGDPSDLGDLAQVARKGVDAVIQAVHQRPLSAETRDVLARGCEREGGPGSEDGLRSLVYWLLSIPEAHLG